MSSAPNFFWVQVVTAAGVIPLEAFVLGAAEPTIKDVIASYEEHDKLEGWSESGQWMAFYPSGIMALGKRVASRKIIAARPKIIGANGIANLDS